MSRRPNPFRGRHSRRRGVIFVVALGVIVILSSLVLVFAQEMRTEALASGNRLSSAQADAIEQGAERWVQANIEANPSDAVTICNTPAEAIQIGGGSFWVLRPDPDTPDHYAFGISDECAKLNLNVADATQLLALPGMTEDVADAIVDWRDADSTPGASGAESDYYESLPEPYECKNAPFETVEELLLVKDVTSDLLWGSDRNHDGVIDDAERAAGGDSTLFDTNGGDGRGLASYVTVNSVEPNTTIDGTQRINVNARDTRPLRDALQTALGAARANTIRARVNAALAATRVPLPFPNLGVFNTTAGMTSAELKLVADQLTTTDAKTLTGMVNVNTAPSHVLLCLPGLEQSDVDALVAGRGGADAGSIAWVFDALPAQKAAGISGAITARSYQYSADIVAVSGDGRAFRRVRIVVDARQLPAKVVYRRDLTALGWPLPKSVRASLRAGRSIAGDVASR